MAHDPRIGERLGAFVLERNLDPRGQGRVYHAIHVEQRRAVAVQVLDGEDVGSTSQAMEQFASELKFLKTLEHPHVVPCFGGGISNGVGYIASELVRGESLAERLAREGPQPWLDLVPWIQQACAALEYAAHRGTLHLALATDKLLLTGQGTIRVAGFRRTRPDAVATIEDELLAERSETDAARQRQRLLYAAPEQICGKPVATTRTDLYALGCILFELLTGRPPFDGATPDALAQQHLTAQPPRISTLLLDCPLWLDTLVGQMLEKSPERRPQYPSDVATALDETRERVTAGTGAAAHAMTRQPTVFRAGRGAAADRHLLERKQRQPRPQRPLHERPWFLGLCLAAVVGFIVWAAWPPGEEALFAKAEALMQTGDRTDMNHAKDRYLTPLLERFPDGARAAKAREYIDRTDMANAEARLKVQAVLGRPPKTAGGRLYVEAFKYEQFGDYATARAKYASLIERHLEGEDRPFALLARRQLAGIEDAAGAVDAAGGDAEFVRQKLAEAEQLRAAGKHAEARAVWEKLLVMYADRAPLADQLRVARERLHDEGGVPQSPRE